jgi:uracil-DNA glycosylase
MNREPGTLGAEEWADLQARIRAMECGPGLGPVPGSGDPTARLVLVGEAPGETEARQGKPFVGAAGRILDQALEAAGLSRDVVWTTNTVKCRPVQGEPPRYRNRAPTGSEVRLWQPLLEEELRLLAPAVIVCLGAVAAKAVIDPKFTMTRQRGQWFPTRFGAEAIATYHPAYLFRLTGEDRDAAIASVEADLRAARERLEAVEPQAGGTTPAASRP